MTLRQTLICRDVHRYRIISASLCIDLGGVAVTAEISVTAYVISSAVIVQDDLDAVPAACGYFDRKRPIACASRIVPSAGVSRRNANARKPDPIGSDYDAVDGRIDRIRLAFGTVKNW